MTYGACCESSDILFERTQTQNEWLAFSLLDKSGDVSNQRTYDELHQSAHAIATDLVERRVFGERVLLLLTSVQDFNSALFAYGYQCVISDGFNPLMQARQPLISAIACYGASDRKIVT